MTAEEKIEALTEAYNHFKSRSALSFMVVAGFYLAPKKLSEADIKWAKEHILEAKKASQ